MAKINAKQLKFVEEYLIDLNATQAAIRAGYSSKRASEIGYQLLQKTTVQDAIDAAMKKREERTEITQDMVLSQLAKIAFADIKDFVEWDSQGNVTVKPAHQIDGTLIAEISSSETENSSNFKFKRNDQMKALEMLGKHLGMFKDKIEHTGENGGPMKVVFNIPRPPKGAEDE